MTDVLRETLEERGRATPWEDVDALMAVGDRRVRRRRVAAGVVTVAVVAVLAVVTPLALGGLPSERAQVASEAYDPGAPSWAVGGTVHVGDLEVDLGEQPGTYVLTDAGVVWIDAAYDVRLTDPSGDAERIGSSTEPAAVALVTDGRYVGWLDRDAEEFVAYDTATGGRAGTVPYEEEQGPTTAESPQLIALEDGQMWTYDQQQRANKALDLTEPYLDNDVIFDAPLGRAFLDVAGGAYVREAAGRRVLVKEVDGDGVRVVPGSAGALLSPDATYVATQPRADSVVFDVEEGLRRMYGSPNSTFMPVRWLDDGTLENLGSGPDRDGPIDVLTCDVPNLACETVAEDVAPSLADVTVADGTVADGFVDH